MLLRHGSMRLVTVLALGAMAGFLGACGGDGKSQQDSGVQDRPLVDVSQQDVAQQDTGTQDGGVQDAAQLDAPNPPGTVVIVQASLQPTGNPDFDPMIAGLKFSFVSAGWDPVDDSGVDVPVTFVDKRNPMGIGCYAKYYKKGQVLDGGMTSDYKPTTANAGELSVTGYTGGKYIVGIDDGGAPVTVDMATTTHCKPVEIMEGDAGTGRYEYICDNTPAGYGGPTAPVTGFLTPGTDKLNLQVAGGPHVSAFTVQNILVAPFISVEPKGTLWSLPALAQASNSDAGVPLNVNCGTEDNPAPCGGGAKALAIQITWGDVDTPMNFFGTPPWENERGKIVCSTFAWQGSTYEIPWDVWNAAFPPGANWRTIQTFVTHIEAKLGKTIVGAGGGQMGMTHAPPPNP